jgi:hypothetical protein
MRDVMRTDALMDGMVVKIFMHRLSGDYVPAAARARAGEGVQSGDGRYAGRRDGFASINGVTSVSVARYVDAHPTGPIADDRPSALATASQPFSSSSSGLQRPGYLLSTQVRDGEDRRHGQHSSSPETCCLCMGTIDLIWQLDYGMCSPFHFADERQTAALSPFRNEVARVN